MERYVKWAKTHNSLLIVTWDEDDFTKTNKIATFMVGPMVKQGVYSSRMNHYTLLRTIEDLYGLGHLGVTGQYAPMTGMWKLPSDGN